MTFGSSYANVTKDVPNSFPEDVNTARPLMTASRSFTPTNIIFCKTSNRAHRATRRHQKPQRIKPCLRLDAV